MGDGMDNKDKSKREIFFERIKKVSPKIFKNYIEADGEAPAVCYRCKSPFLVTPIETIDSACEEWGEISYLKPCKENYIVDIEDTEDNQYDLDDFYYKVSCTRCSAEMTFNIKKIVEWAEKMNEGGL